MSRQKKQYSPTVHGFDCRLLVRAATDHHIPFEPSVVSLTEFVPQNTYRASLRMLRSDLRVIICRVRNGTNTLRSSHGV